jgi:hypothetical protein
MKKIVVIFLLFTIISCASYRSFYLLEKDYGTNQNTEVINDIYVSLKTLDIDSIPINNWITFQGSNDDEGYFIQRIIKKNDKKTNYTLVFTTFYNDSTYYNYKIRCKTKDKNIWLNK